MAIRPVYIVNNDQLIEDNIDFTWYSGFSIQQKQKSIESLHKRIINKYEIKRIKILEVSSKSPNNLGVHLSAFNMKLKIKNYFYTVESIFQSSKRFEYGGPYIDIMNMPSIKAKKDPRLKDSGKLLSFQLLNETWPKEPKTLFYDWIYMSSIYSNKQLHEEIIKYKSFTYIEFNPKKTYHCPSRSAAHYVRLINKGMLDKLMKNKEEYKNYFKKEEYSQMSMFNDSDFYQ